MLNKHKIQIMKSEHLCLIVSAKFIYVFYVSYGRELNSYYLKLQFYRWGIVMYKTTLF